MRASWDRLMAVRKSCSIETFVGVREAGKDQAEQNCLQDPENVCLADWMSFRVHNCRYLPQPLGRDEVRAACHSNTSSGRLPLL